MTRLLTRLFIKNPDDVKNNNTREAYGSLSGVVGIICNLLLCAFKITVGLLTASISIIADGFNNLSDMGSSVITILGFKLANKPADKDHPFGHGRIEYMSAFIVAILIMLVGFELMKTSVTALANGTAMPVYSIASIIVLAVSVIFKLWLYIFNRKIGKKIESETLLATAQDSLNDSIATAVILLSVAVSKMVALPFNLDAVMGIAVSLFILFAGINAAKETLNRILGEPPSPELITDIEAAILSRKDFVGIHDLIVHNYGPGRLFASVHVEVPQDINIVECHEQIDLCEKEIYDNLGVSLVIHMDPMDVNNEQVAFVRSQLSDGIKVIHPDLTLHDFRMTPMADTQTNLVFDVVIPQELKLSEKELNGKISQIAKLINPTFCCVITFDRDFTGR
ncbi:MAG: cation transporter [Ruminococcaceae bacterium]|nr:cation transporter [Oscillospiraceae bacterium]